MPQNIAAAKVTIGLMAGSSASIVGAGASAFALTDQLNKGQDFMHMSLPLWFFLAGVLVISALGAIAAFFTDIYMDAKTGITTSYPRRVGNALVGFMSGLVGTFVVLPAFTTSPPMAILWVTALVMSFAGSVLVKNAAELKRDEDLQRSVRGLLKNYLNKMLALLGGGK